MSATTTTHATGCGAGGRAAFWTLAVTGVALFMTALDNLVVGVALPSIRADLGGSLESLEWTVNAYTLGVRRASCSPAPRSATASAASACSSIGLGALHARERASRRSRRRIEALIAARALQGVGAAIVTPLTLTLLSEAFPPERRGVALGDLGAGSAASASRSGPLVGGAVVEGISWHWIFWLNVPIGLALMPARAAGMLDRVATARQAPRPRAGSALAGHRPVRPRRSGSSAASALGWTSADRARAR